MSRQVRMALLTCFGLGISASAVDAQSPSAWDPVFSSTSYQPYTAYYTGYSGFFGIPYSTSYVPYAPSCGCSQAAYVGSSCGGCSPCGGCASGNCASGNCSTTTNLAPGGGLAPVADPTNQSTNYNYTRSLENRLQHIERYLEKTDQNFAPPAQDKFRGTGTNRGDRYNDIPTRQRQPASGLDQQGTFEDPVNGTSTDDKGMFKSNKVNTEKATTEKTDGEAKKDSSKSKKGPAPMSPPDGSMRILDTQVTSRAVAPRERLSFQNASSMIASTRKTSPLKQEVDAGPRSINLARQ